MSGTRTKERRTEGFSIALPDLQRDVMLAVRVPEPLRVRARKLGLDHRTNLQEIVIAALDEYLKKRGA